MPVFWYALSQTQQVDTADTVIVFIILHLFVYPASNGYNSYMDRDTSSIGGVKNPKQPTRQLFYATILMDAAAIALGVFISLYFTIALLAYILASRAYSYRGIRLKKYPVVGYVTVVFFQGAVAFWLVMHGCSVNKIMAVPYSGMLAASLLIGGFYPLTQIYQHKQDKADGVTTLSMLLGYTGTFVFTALVYAVAMVALGYQLLHANKLQDMLVIQIFFIPVLLYFLWWFKKVFHQPENANFANTMRMTVLASIGTNTAFITLFLIEKL